MSERVRGRKQWYIFFVGTSKLEKRWSLQKTQSKPVRRMASAEHGATADGSELDSYLPHLVNLEKAKEYIKANVSEGMSRDEVAEVVKQAMELHIPPVPSLEELLQQEESAQKLEKQQRLQKDLERSKDCLLYTSPSPRDQRGSRMPSSA